MAENVGLKSFVYAYEPYANGDRVKVSPSQSSKFFDFYLERSDASLLKIKEVVLPIQFSKIPCGDRLGVLKHTYPVISILSNQSTKLRLHFRILGGTNLSELMKSNPENYKIEKYVISHMPEKTYSWVSVISVNHSFLGGPEEPARIIALKPFGNRFEEFMVGIKRFLVGARFKDKTTYSGTTIAGYLLGDNNDADAKQQVMTAYENRREIRIYLSNDGMKFYAWIEQDKGACVIS
jgi:hypothetical protein